MSQMMTCAGCGASRPEHLIDMKPTRLAGPNHTTEDLAAAADRGEDFDRPECVTCYGPGWCAADPT